MNLDNYIPIARGDKEADLLFINCKIINVFSGKITTGNIAISDGTIIGIGEYKAKEIIDLDSAYVAPGFFDAHLHIESSMTCVSEFVRAVLPFGTTSVAADPHEIANVLGADGIRYMLDSAKNQPMNIFFTLPSCVPATDMETSGASISAEDLAPFFNHEKVIALAEMMNFPGVIFGDPGVISKIDAARSINKPVDGHAPGLSGKELNTYAGSGITSDHECTTPGEAIEKLEAGMHIMVREGTGAKNLKALLPVINEQTSRRMMWCTDDRHPHDLVELGHIDSIIRDAIKSGIDPVTAIQMATINPAEYFGLKDIGAIAPGRKADLVVFKDFENFKIEKVFTNGKIVAENGEMLSEIEKPETEPPTPSMNVNIKNINFKIKAETDKIRVIELVPDQLVTKQQIEPATIINNHAVSDTSRDILKIAVIERHNNTGNMGKGFVKGIGLKKGAIASSVAHDSHNIIVVGTNDKDMLSAVSKVVEMGGGLAAAIGNDITALPLPIAGLMSTEPVQTVRSQLDKIIKVVHGFGAPLKNPFMILSFLALPVIPEIKITDKGVVDVEQFKIVQLFYPDNHL
ncbi:MAG: adenine deaminase [Desulfobacterales bacterium]|nr:adenine deaminase [Desulfobacterales bacterium]